MSDIFTDVIGSYLKRFRDMGDTSHAEVVYAVLDTTVGAGASIGATTDDAASSSIAETTTARTGIGLWKGIKNVLILINTVVGVTSGAAVITDTTGTIQQYLRGIVKLLAAHITVKVEPEVSIPLSGSISAIGPTELIAAPAAGYRLVVTSFVIQNEAATANLMQIHMGAVTAGFRCNAATQDVGLSKDFAKGNEWRGAAATALSITNSAATAVGYSVLYYTEAV